MALPVSSASRAQAQKALGGKYEIEEIVVTAQKRSERLSDVPIAVTVASSENVLEGGVVGLEALPQIVPGLLINEHSNYQNVYLRGIGSSFSQLGISQSVSTYVDGVLVPVPMNVTNVSLMDIERVEVLKGPQGTLYGRNATGGAINVITRTPPEQLTAELRATAANWNYRGGSFYLGGPLVGKEFRVSVAGYYNYRDPEVVNRGGPPPQAVENYGGRAKASYRAANGIEADAIVGYTYVKAEGSFYQLQPNSLGAGLGGQQSSEIGVVYNDYDRAHLSKDKNASFRISVPVRFFNLVSLTGYRDFTAPRYGGDGDATSVAYQAFAPRSLDTMYTEELNLLSTTEGPFEWTAGFFFLHEFSANELRLFLGPAITRVPGYTRLVMDSEVTQKSYAGFVQGRYALTKAMNFTAGMRYTHDEAEYSGGSVNRGPRTPALSADWNDVSPKFTLDYKIGDTLLYATGGKGYKAGAFNFINFAKPGPLGPEKLWTAELGVKTGFGRFARFEASIYNYWLTGQQVWFSPRDLTYLNAIENAGAASLRGLDFSGLVTPLPGLSINGGASWLFTARYDDYEEGSLYIDNKIAKPAFPYGYTVTSQNLNGRRMQEAPELTGNITIKYDWESPAGTITPGGNVYFRTKTDFSAQNAKITRQDGYALENVFLNFATRDGHWNASLWCQNLSNEKYFTTKLIGVTGVLGWAGLPRSYGVTIGYNY